LFDSRQQMTARIRQHGEGAGAPAAGLHRRARRQTESGAEVNVQECRQI
jgi:hypothetical protein